jgi:hypothetical protein
MYQERQSASYELTRNSEFISGEGRMGMYHCKIREVETKNEENIQGREK